MEINKSKEKTLNLKYSAYIHLMGYDRGKNKLKHLNIQILLSYS